MSDLMLRTAVTARIFIAGLAARLAEDERGQDAIEYVGVLAVVAVIIGVVITVASGLAKPITSGVSKEIASIFK